MGNTARRAPANWMIIAAIFTVVYAAAVAFWGYYGEPGMYVETSKLNSFGDFLAGAFAPIALIWLVAAVLTQRQELTETRTQFEESQRVVRAQMDYIERQNRNAEETAKKNHKLALFDHRFKVYEELRNFYLLHDSKEYDAASSEMIAKIRMKAAFVFSKEVEDWVIEIGEEVDRMAKATKLLRDIEKNAREGVRVPEEMAEEVTRKQEKILEKGHRRLWGLLERGDLNGRIMESLRISDE